MQRDSVYKNNIKYFFIFLLFVTYESLSSIYLYLSPLFGVAFYYIIENIHKKEYFFRVVLAFFYIIIFEIDKGFVPFSFFITFVIYYFFIYYRVEIFFNGKYDKIFFHILLGYLFYYFVNISIDYLYDFELPLLDIKHIFYILTDYLIAVVLF